MSAATWFQKYQATAKTANSANLELVTRSTPSVTSNISEISRKAESVKNEREPSGSPPATPEAPLLHPRACPDWWKACLAGCPWYHGETADFCWKVNIAWWERAWDNIPSKESAPKV